MWICVYFANKLGLTARNLIFTDARQQGIGKGGGGMVTVGF